MSIRLIDDIFSIIGAHPLENVEVEVRFNYMGHNTVPYPIFRRLRDKLDSIAKSTKTETKDQTNKDGIRRSLDDSLNQVSLIRKERLKTVFINEYALKLSVSLETDVSSELLTKFIPVIERNKKRNSYTLYNSDVRVDLTQVDETKFDTGVTTTKYEVEVELVNITKDGYNHLVDATNDVFRWMYNTEQIYTLQEKSDLISYINSKLSKTRDPKSILIRGLIQARNLVWDDLRDGELTGQKTKYVAHHKIDGERKLVVITDSGIWLAYPPNDINLISRNSPQQFIGTIVDAEEIPHNRRRSENNPPKSKYWLIANDMVLYAGTDISSEEFDIRKVKSESVSNYFTDNSLIQITTDSIFNLFTPDEFFKSMREMFRQKPKLRYIDDGIIIKPLNAAYQPNTDKQKLVDRRLSAFPDVLKWKPQDRLTVDLTLRWVVTDPKQGMKPQFQSVSYREAEYIYNGKPLYFDFRSTILRNNAIISFSFDATSGAVIPQDIVRKKHPDSYQRVAEIIRSKSNETFDLRIRATRERTTLLVSEQILLPFTGTASHPFNVDNMNISDPNGILDRVDSGAVLELAYNVKTNTLIIYRIRDDKPLPNTDEIAKDNWDMIFNWIPDTTLRGEDFGLLSKEIERTIKPLSYNMIRNFDIDDRIYDTPIDNTVCLVGVDGDVAEHLFNPKLVGPSYSDIKLGPVNIKYSNGDIIATGDPDAIKPLRNGSNRPISIGDLLANGFELMTCGRFDSEPFMHSSEREVSDIIMYALMKRVEKKSSIIKTFLPEAPVRQIPDTLPPNPIVPTEQVEKLEETGGYLPFLGVSVPRRLADPGRGDDKIQKLECSWWDNVYRIACIPDGSCFIHAVLKACYLPYQEDNSYRYRIDLAKNVRDALADYLPEIYLTFSGGIFQNFAAQQLLDPELLKITVDYSLEGLQKLLRSTRFIGDELYKLVGESLGVDIYIIRGTNRNLFPHTNTTEAYRRRRSIVVMGQGAHYETIAIMSDGLLQTVFDANHPFLIQLRKLQTDETGYKTNT
jgi:hypothetical protein